MHREEKEKLSFFIDETFKWQDDPGEKPQPTTEAPKVTGMATSDEELVKNYLKYVLALKCLNPM